MAVSKPAVEALLGFNRQQILEHLFATYKVVAMELGPDHEPATFGLGSADSQEALSPEHLHKQ